MVFKPPWLYKDTHLLNLEPNLIQGEFKMWPSAKNYVQIRSHSEVLQIRSPTYLLGNTVQSTTIFHSQKEWTCSKVCWLTLQGVVSQKRVIRIGQYLQTTFKLKTYHLAPYLSLLLFSPFLVPPILCSEEEDKNMQILSCHFKILCCSRLASYINPVVLYKSDQLFTVSLFPIQYGFRFSLEPAKERDIRGQLGGEDPQLPAKDKCFGGCESVEAVLEWRGSFIHERQSFT